MRKTYADVFIAVATVILQMSMLNGTSKVDFGPNQLAANVWYKPRKTVINGHYRNSYSNFSLWSSLRTHLSNHQGAMILQAAEIGFMADEDLITFRQNNILIAAALPAFTQCFNGTVLANLELYGQSPSAQNLFCSIFNICQPIDRQDPNRRGWFVTEDGIDYTPELLNFDERMPNLVSYLAYEKLMNTSSNPPQWCHPDRSWIDRKNQARVDPCPQAGTDRIANLMQDYVRYLSVMNKKFHHKTMPQIQVNWNVVPGWEWRDEQCLDRLYDKYPEAADFDHAYRYLTDPCHRDTEYLQDLLKLLCSIGHCPEVVYMDMDLVYLTSYALEVLHQNKQVLISSNVSFGISLVDQCVERDNCVVENSPVGGARLVLNLDAQSTYPNLTRNDMQEISLINTVQFLLDREIIDADTRIAIISWTSWPSEVGSETAESRSGGMAHTANRILEEILLPCMPNK